MPFPASWPPRPPSGRRSIRFYVHGTATALFTDSAFLLLDGVQSIPYETVQKLNYKLQATNFTIGETITGQISLATGVVYLDVDAGATGTLTLRNVVGIFNPLEQILGSVTGDATTDGAPTTPAFTVGETITGQTSGATAVVNTAAFGLLTLTSVTGEFRTSEHILGGVSGDALTNGLLALPANPYTPLPNIVSGVPTVVPPTPSGTGVATDGLPAPMIWAQTFRICNDGGGTLEYSHDGINVHGKLLATQQLIARCRPEAGIALRGLGAVYRVEAW